MRLPFTQTLSGSLLISLLTLLATASVRAGLLQELNTPHAVEIMRQAKSAAMRNYMDQGVQPCNDFYTHACGNWPKIYPANDDKVTNQFALIERGYMRRVQQLLERPKLNTDNIMETRIKYFYESCLNRTALSLNYRAKLMSLLEEFGGLPVLKGDDWQGAEFDWQETMVKMLRRYGKETLVGLEISADLSNSQVNRLYIGEPKNVPAGRPWFYFASRQPMLQFQLQQMLGMNEVTAAKTALEVIEVQFKLARGMNDPLSGRGMEDRMTLRMLDEMDETYKPIVNFTSLISSWLGYEYRLPVYEQETYLRYLRRVLEKIPRQKLANYMLITLLKDFRFEWEETESQHHALCAEKTSEYFPSFVDRMAYRSLEMDNPSIPASFKKLWLNLKEVFEELLLSPQSDWLDDATRAAALAKLKAMTYKVRGAAPRDFEEDYGTLIINTEDYFENVHRILELRGLHLQQRLLKLPSPAIYDSVNKVPIYLSEFNLVLIPTSFMLHRYFWDDALPAALKYATVGSILAHEMVHGFDDSFRKYDAQGNLKNWWSRNATLEFSKRKQCLLQQFSNLRYYDIVLPWSRAQGENIADNVGVRLAYAAYIRWMEREPEQAGETESLPRMTQTPEQLFFVALAQLWCMDATHEWRQTMHIGDVHPPVEQRIYAMLANFEDFAKVFQCRMGAPMNPTKKCVVY